MALEWGGRENQASISQCRFSLWTNWTLTTVRALVWSKTHTHIFMRKEGERESRSKTYPQNRPLEAAR